MIPRLLQIPDIQGLKDNVNLIYPVFKNEDIDISFSYKQRASRRENLKGPVTHDSMATEVRIVNTFRWVVDWEESPQMNFLK